MITVEVIIPKELFDMKRIERAVDWGLDTASKQLQREFNETTATWTHRPTFLIVKSQGERTIYTSDKIYSYVSLGTKPHQIRARNARTLHFFSVGFSPKTRVRRIRATAGSAATSGEVFPVAVQHPGTQAREFEKVLAEQWQKELPDLLQEAIHKGLS